MFYLVFFSFSCSLMYSIYLFFVYDMVIFHHHYLTPSAIRLSPGGEVQRPFYNKLVFSQRRKKPSFSKNDPFFGFLTIME